MEPGMCMCLGFVFNSHPHGKVQVDLTTTSQGIITLGFTLSPPPTPLRHCFFFFQIIPDLAFLQSSSDSPYLRHLSLSVSHSSPPPFPIASGLCTVQKCLNLGTWMLASTDPDNACVLPPSLPLLGKECPPESEIAPKRTEFLAGIYWGVWDWPGDSNPFVPSQIFTMGLDWR